MYITDINECEDKHICPAGRRCVNVISAYMCLCLEGYQFNEKGECVKKSQSVPCTELLMIEHKLIIV